VKIVIAPQFFFEPAIFVMEFIEGLGDVMREVEGRGFDI
jgi:hypothetical protein